MSSYGPISPLRIRFAKSAGLGPFIEVQATGVGVLVIEEADGTGNNFGDWSLGTKLRLLTEKGRRPAVGVLGEVKLPVASDDRGGATDETDFAGSLLLSKRLGERSRLHLNLGAELLGDPGARAAQNDVFLARLAAQRRIGSGDLIGVELVVQDGPSRRDSPRSLRAIYLRRLGRWAFQAGLAIGLSDDADDAALDLGVRRTLRWGGKR